MSRLSKSGASFFLLLFFAAFVVAQPAPKKSEEDLKRERERLQAISMIEESAAEAPFWNEKKAAIAVLAEAADLLWDQDSARAVKWLTKGWELSNQVSDAPKDERLKEFFTRSDRTELRSVILNVANRHDRALADKFLKQLAQQETSEKRERGAFDDRTARSQQLLQMAQQTVDANPELAFTLAEQSLTDGISFALQNVLLRLRKKNIDLANRLFDLAMLRLNSENPEPSEAQVMSGYLFETGYTFATNSSGHAILAINPLQQNAPAVALSEPQRAKAFLVAVFEKLISPPLALETPEGRLRAQQISFLGSRLTGPFRTYAPELAASALGLLAQLRNQISPETGTNPGSSRSDDDATRRLTKEEIYEKRISELEEKAEQESNPAFKKIAYVQAALAVNTEDYTRAKRIAEKIDDSDLRADAVSFLLYRAALFFLEKSDPEKASEIVPQIGDSSRRAVAKIAIAQRILSARPGPDDRSLLEQNIVNLLNDVEGDLIKQEPSTKIARILIGRIAILAQFDKEQALTSIQHVILLINKLSNFDLSDGGAPDLGLSLSPPAGATVSRPRLGFGFRDAVEPLIVTNFEQLATAAEGLTAKEVRGAGRLEVAKLYLRETQTAKRPL